MKSPWKLNPVKKWNLSDWNLNTVKNEIPVKIKPSEKWNTYEKVWFYSTRYNNAPTFTYGDPLVSEEFPQFDHLLL